MGRSYTSAGAPVPFEFELDGVRFVAAGGVQVLELSELALHAEQDVTSAAGVALLAQLFRNALGDDYERFRAHCRTHSTGPETLLDIVQGMTEHLADRPIQPSGQSLPGRPNTTGSFAVDLPPEQPLTDEEIRRYREYIRSQASA